MPKRKKVKSYGNSVTPLFTERYLNQWSNNQETKEDLKMVSFLIPAIGGSAIQILICEDELYNGIFHLQRFTFVESSSGDAPSLVIDDLEVLYDFKPNMGDLSMVLGSLAEKYEALVPLGFPSTDDPLSLIETLPKLIME